MGARASDRTRADGLAISPWVMVERRTGAFSWRAAAGASAQYPDPLLVFGAGARVRPEEAMGADVGVEHRLGAASSWRVSVFARRESHGLRPARSRGFEIVLTRQAASGLGGWIGYSWSHTRMRDVATGERFDADFDQRHTLNAVVTGRLSYRTNVGAKLRIGSNTPIVGYFEGTPDDMRLGALRNAARLPLYARLDLRAARTFTFDARRLTLFVEVMNTLRRENFGQAEGSIRASLEANGFVERLIPMVPSAGLLIEF
jgi:hypothetical protein